MSMSCFLLWPIETPQRKGDKDELVGRVFYKSD